MSQTARTKVHVDSWVEHASQYKSHGAGAKLRVRSDASNLGRRSFMQAHPPYPDGSTVKSAILRVNRHGDWATAVNLKVQRVTEKWKENQVNWNNQPATDTPSEVTFHAPAGNDQDEFAIDVTTIFADQSAGHDYHGLRITSDDDTSRSLYASESPIDGVNPKIDFEWTQAPYPPWSLHPGGGGVIGIPSPRLGWHFSDDAGTSTRQGWSQVQIASDPNFVGILYDSTKVANTRHEWSLAGEYAILAGAPVYWRVKVWDQDNFESGWSDGTEITLVAKGDFQITNPAVAPDNFVDDLTPPISFSLTGATLKRVRMKVSKVKDNGSLKKWFEFPEQKVDPTFNTITIPRRTHLVRNTTFLVELWAWDDQDRRATSGDPAHYYAQREFTYVRSGVPSPVETITATPAYGDLFALGKPKAQITWTRTTEPDWFCLVVDDEEVFARIDPADVMIAPETYQIDYWRARDGVSSTYEVEAVVTDPVIGHAQHSQDNPTDSAITDVQGKWIVDEDDSTAVQIYSGEDSPDFEIGESGTTNFPVGGRTPQRSTDSIREFEGSTGGMIRNTAIKDLLLTLKGRMKPLRYLQQDLNIPVRMAEMSLSPISEEGQAKRWSTTLNLLQIDEFFDVVGF